MANGVMTEANSVNDVSRMMDTIKASISETQEYSDQIKAVSTAINQVVANSSREIDEMSEQMQTINAAVSAPLWSMLQNYRREWKISPTFYAEYPK
jgi:methyl-accepting chemotaxis protein